MIYGGYIPWVEREFHCFRCLGIMRIYAIIAGILAAITIGAIVGVVVWLTYWP